MKRRRATRCPYCHEPTFGLPTLNDHIHAKHPEKWKVLEEVRRRAAVKHETWRQETETERLKAGATEDYTQATKTIAEMILALECMRDREDFGDPSHKLPTLVSILKPALIGSRAFAEKSAEMLEKENVRWECSWREVVKARDKALAAAEDRLMRAEAAEAEVERLKARVAELEKRLVVESDRADHNYTMAQGVQARWDEDIEDLGREVNALRAKLAGVLAAARKEMEG